MVILLSCETKAACDSVKLTPEDNNNMVLNRGRAHGFITLIPFGGQIAPIQIDGDVDK